MNKLKLKEQIYFLEQIAFLLKASVPIMTGLMLIKNQSRQKKKMYMYEKIMRGVSEGQTLAFSLRPFIGEFAFGIIHAGEQSGFLSANLFHLTKHLKHKQMMVSKILQAFLYPALVGISTVGITIFLILYIFPKILPIIRSLRVDLPFTTKTILFLSSFLTHFWSGIIMGIFLFVVLFIYFFKRHRRFTYFIHRNILRVPLFGNIYRDFLLTYFCNNLSLLLEGGVTIDRALHISALTSPNLFFQERLYETYEFVVGGQQFSEYLFSHPEMFPETFSQIVSIGEETGNLQVILAELSELYENEFSEKIKSISQTLEPFLLIMCGLIVGFVALSIISPVYEVTQNLQKH